jgi:pimeloyl-ACP methyl ester carboxylesterase
VNSGGGSSISTRSRSASTGRSARLGLGEPRDVLLIGYSQGASVAELLAAREPEKFTRIVLIAKPSKPDPWHFKKARAVATMAGTLDAQQAMIQGSRALAAAGVRARYFPLPGAAHGYMGDDPEGTFENVFAWLYEEPPG